MRETVTVFLKSVARAALPFAVVFIGACGPAGDPTLEEIFERRCPVDPNATTISVTARDGSIRIYGAGGNVREVQVEAVKKAYTPERLKAINVQVTQRQNSISIETVYPPDGGTFSDRSGTVDYVIVVPQAATISKLELGNGEVLIEEMRSKEAHAQLGSGRLFVHNCFGSVDIGVKTGNVALVYEWWEEERDFSISAVIDDGNAFAYLPEEAAFHLIARTDTGKIGNDFEDKEQRGEEFPKQIDMLVGGADRPKIQIESRDGNIRIAEHSP